MVCRILTVWCTVAFLCVHSTGWSHNYFPMRKGNGWFNINPYGVVRPLDYFYSVGDSLIRKGQVYYVMQYFLLVEGKITYPDTLRKDTLGNVWRYGIQQDTLWFDFSDDTTVGYNYGKYSVKKRIADTIITPSGVYKHCLCLTFIDSTNNGHRFIFKDSIGIIDRALFYSGNIIWNRTRLKSAFVNGVSIGTPTNTYDYFPLQIGNVWVYHTEKSFPCTLIHKIEDTAIIDSKVYFRFSVNPLRGENRGEYLLRKDTISGNVYIRVGQEEELLNTISFSLIEGAPYFYKSSLSDTAIESWYEVTHTVPAGTFEHCRYYKMDNWPGMYDDEYYYIYAPGVGLIADHNDGSIPFFSKLIYAIIDGKHIGPQVEIKLATAPQIPVKNVPRTFVLVKGSHPIFSFNEHVQVFSLNGRSMGAINCLPGKGFAQGIFIIKNKQ